MNADSRLLELLRSLLRALLSRPKDDRCRMKRSHIHQICIALALGALLLFASVVVAQSGESYTLLRWTVGGGGVTSRENGSYTLNSTIGQPDAWVWTGGDYTVGGGFWNGDRETSTPLTSVGIEGPASGQLGVLQIFTATVSPLTAATPITYTWKASGQTPVIHTATLSHSDPATFTWSVTGIQAITVTASNSLNTVTETTTITIVEYAAPVAAFTASPLSGTVPLEVQFTDQSTGDVITWDWDFGDGNVSGARYPSHVYEIAGTYTVTLTVTGPGGTDTKVIANYITVLPPTTWTFMLYFAGDNNLHSHLEDAIDELERVANKDNVDILVLWDGAQNGDTRLYHVLYDTRSGITSPIIPVGWNPGELNTGRSQALIDFVSWARNNYPADHYFLSIANHGRGTTGIGWDDTSGGDNLSAYVELETALNSVTSGGSNKIDVLYLDACLMGLVEDAYEVKDYVDYIVASENLGWSVFAYDAYVANTTDDTTPEELATGIADDYFSALHGYPGTVSALDMSVVGDVGSATDTLAQALDTYLNITNVSEMITVRNSVQTFDSRNYLVLDSNDEYVDLYHFAELVKTTIGDATVQNAAQGVMDAITACVIAEHHQSGTDPWSGNYWELGDAHGIAIYFPPKSGGWDYSNYVTGGSWAFCNATAWDEFLTGYFSMSGLPPEPPIDPGVPPMQMVERVFLPLVTRGD